MIRRQVTQIVRCAALFGVVFGAVSGGAVAAHPLVDEIETRCTPIITVQKGMCEVDRFFRCGDQGYVVMSAEGGAIGGVEFSDSAGRLGDFIALDGRGSLTIQETQDPLDLTALRDTGSERSRYAAVLDLDAPAEITIDLNIVVSDNVVTRGGLRFRTGSAGMEMTTEAPMGGFSRVWDILVAEDENLVITGRSTMVTERGTREFETDIREILVPGDAGFQSHQGRHDCGEEL